MVSGFVYVFINSSLTLSTVIPENYFSSSVQDDNCVLPPYPKHGRYTVSNYPSATPRDSYPSVELKVSCDIGYLISDNTTNSILCVNDEWSASIPTCIDSSQAFSTVDAENDSSSPIQEDNCVLPPYPKHGKYTVSKYPSAKPGDSYPSVKLEVSCDIGHLNDNTTNIILCVNDEWSASMPTCVGFCTLINNMSIEYRCEKSGSFNGSQKCETLVPAGTIVTPFCRSPNYFSHGVLPKMHCEKDGNWDYNPICRLACGTKVSLLQLDGTSSDQVGLPWHAGIYNKVLNPYMQFCAGSLVTVTKIISAAHCFWHEKRKLRPADQYAVAVGKLYRPYNEPRDLKSQKSNVVHIQIPFHFQGAATNYQDDIAIVAVETPFVYNPFVLPICLDFDKDLDRTQLIDGNLGKAAGWSIADKKSQSPVKIVDLPYIKIADCFDMSPPNFRQYLTNDKFCAGSNNGTLLCMGDSGAGLAFPDSNSESQQYYLRGVLSIGPATEDTCDTFNTFTSIIKHEDFIKQYLY